MIDNIVTVVFRIHFGYINNKDLEQDLKQEGYLKAYELLSLGNYDPTKNLRTFIYTGVRNAMTNYMYHHKKESHTDLDFIYSSSWKDRDSITLDDYWNNKLFYTNENEANLKIITLDDIKTICNKYTMFGDYIDTALFRCNELGLYISDYNKSNILNEPKSVVDAIVGEILWNYFD
jgi:hypothetical protein